MTDAVELIGHIYDAALDGALWPEVLIRLSDAVGGAEVCMFDCNPRAHFAVLIAPRHDPDYVRTFTDAWLGGDLQQRSNVVGHRLFDAPVGQVLDVRQLVTVEELVHTDFFNGWWRPQSLGLVTLATKWCAHRDGWGFTCVHRSPAAGEFEAEKARLFTLVMPHLVRAAHFHHRLRHLTLEREAATLGLNQIETGVVFVDASARVVYANDAAANLVRAADGLFVDKSELKAIDPDASTSLRRLIARCADRRFIESGPGGAVSVRRGGRSPLHVMVAPVGAKGWQARETWPGMLSPVAILIVNDPERERQMCRAHLRETYGLTPAEAEVALEIGRGGGRKAAAVRLAITSGTVRIHLQRIFDKVGVHRQAELVRLLADARNGYGNTGRGLSGA
jgi:DNA-binding CsgD family transcriptional regulator